MKIYIFYVLAFFSVSITFCQVGIGTTDPESTLDLRATNHNGAVTGADGILVPRVNDLTTAGTVNGQLVYLIADAGGFTQGFHYWNGTIWATFRQNIPANGVVFGSVPPSTLNAASFFYDPTNLQSYYRDNNGNIKYLRYYTPQNGLVNDNNNYELGGSLIKDTDIDNDGFDFSMTGAGNFGIGTDTPSEKLEVNGKVVVSDLTGTAVGTDVVVTADATTGELKQGGTVASLSNIPANGVVFGSVPPSTTNAASFFYDPTNLQSYYRDNNGNIKYLRYYTPQNGLVNDNNNYELGGTLLKNTDIDNDGFDFSMTGAGNFGIGTDTPSEKLEVVGNILASGTITPDYVFQNYFNKENSLKPSYKMMNLKQVEDFVKKNNHLPGVSSYKEVVAEGGIILNRASEQQLEKIEELFLHTIEQQKTIESLEAENDALKTRLSKIEAALNIKN